MADKVNLHRLTEQFVPTPSVDDPPITSEMEAVDPAFSKLYLERVEILRSYLVLAENPADLMDENYRKNVFAKLSYGMRKAGDYLGWGRYHLRVAYGDRKRAEAIAALDEFGAYLASRKATDKEVKATDKVRDFYVHINTGVTQAVAREAFMEAVVEQLSTMKQEFMMAISTIKAMAYGNRDSDFMSGASVAVNSQQ
jgi:hypothetical protein